MTESYGGVVAADSVAEDPQPSQIRRIVKIHALSWLASWVLFVAAMVGPGVLEGDFLTFRELA